MNDKLTGVVHKYEIMTARPENEVMQADNTDKSGGDTGVEISLKKHYDAVSKNGDTLELSRAGKLMEQNSDKNIAAAKNSAGGKISDTMLSGYSDAKLKQLYSQKAITKQQYDKAVKKRKKLL